MAETRLEICCTGIESVNAAKVAGADSIELCSVLSSGGVTPSLGFLQQCAEIVDLPIRVLVRPRDGDFVYSTDEKLTVIGDLKSIVNFGFEGVVTGALTAAGSVDMIVNKEFKGSLANGLMRFSRAFDLISDPDAALEDLIECGFDSVLTSGGKSSVGPGIKNIKRLVSRAEGRLVIVAGGGLTPSDIPLLLDSGVTQFHLSATDMVPIGGKQLDWVGKNSVVSMKKIYDIRMAIGR